MSMCPSGNLGLRLGATSKELVAALLPLTTHKRYRVRIAAIQAIRDVMHQVGGASTSVTPASIMVGLSLGFHKNLRVICQLWFSQAPSLCRTTSHVQGCG